jgi:phosphoribosylamine-glycine ligase
MITPRSGAKVLEYNVRFGDPETQSLLPLLQTDLAEIMLACTSGSLSSLALQVSSNSAATVVVAAGGYPDAYKKGIEMKVSKPSSDDVVIVHAGTALEDDGKKLVTSGGRVIAATAVADTLAKAVDLAYEGVGCIDFDGMQYRTDIAARSLT